MLLRRFGFDKQNAIPPRALLGTGIVLLGGGFIWPEFPVLHGTMSASGVDFIQGVLLGLGLACEIMGVMAMAARRRKDEA